MKRATAVILMRAQDDAVAADRGGSLDEGAVRSAWQDYCASEADTSFFVWQWVTLRMLARRVTTPPGAAAPWCVSHA
jgi:hypothetical protein